MYVAKKKKKEQYEKGLFTVHLPHVTLENKH